MTVAGVLLAAGAGSRFRGRTHKLLADLDGRPVILHSLDAVLAAGFDAIIVVDGALPLDDVVPPGVLLVHNARWSEGQATSLQAALEAASAAGHDAVVVGLGDQPRVLPAAWRAVGAATRPIAVANYGGMRRNPVRLAREVWPLLPVDGDEGARAVMRARPDLVVDVACEGDPLDVDTEDDLHRLQS